MQEKNNGHHHPTTLHQRVVWELLTCSRLHHALCEKMMGRIGIHRSQHHMLMFLSREESIPSQKQIANYFHVSPAAVAVTLKKLENGGYIERIVSQNDNRFNEIHVTPKGYEVAQQSVKYFNYIDAAPFLGFKEEEIDQLRSLLERMAENLKHASDDSELMEKSGLTLLGIDTRKDDSV